MKTGQILWTIVIVCLAILSIACSLRGQIVIGFIFLVCVAIALQALKNNNQ
jgi:hypothetical protein